MYNSDKHIEFNPPFEQESQYTLIIFSNVRFGEGSSALFSPMFNFIQVFGRISEPSLIGSVIPSSKERLGSNSSVKKLKWKSLFENEAEKLSLDRFSERLNRCVFSWPLDYMTNRTAPFLIPLKFRNRFKIKCKCFPINIGVYNELKAKVAEKLNVENANISISQLNQFIKSEPIDKESIESTFKALSGEENLLTLEHIMAYIHYRSPLVEMINWNCFISSLPVGPDDSWSQV
ncbi:conserved hypothetical protein [Theileria orientalis strain Shintoku]|uniref:Uncharacterized protein n=1 Tax=Theileria orientalis strain Shintoku TaxID=869250 RepID=J4C3V5_THEOR|nr:conserved hypothetical protein [Theileria orientalis strain Shintoku]PVC54398.1 hypothetical protein MACL_00003108 [Theileria orientalis]BAM41101.1 conserved hypothetical protein [Theileria orientalis strain Shintoku]|eukprot:XP_009691402.1 conserved hypothetical protein [Theileria orientalis strain Shintoku]